ncbi:hypothetical protein NC652_028752 [Populus alba x Populus x berolinensis]|nr:hypothetical protein NC652_028752 [Populus alba x Populus x berolinensis]
MAIILDSHTLKTGEKYFACRPW